MFICESDRLRMRVLESTDAPWVLELVGGEDWIRNIGDRGVRTLTDAEVYIERMRDRHEKHGYSFYGVFSKETGEGLGICGFALRDGFTMPDVGFAFLPRHYRNGYAYESGAAVLNFARTKLGLTEVLGITSPTNKASIATLEKLGLIRDPNFVGDPAFEPAVYFRKRL